jgi:simple sugar transport system permease protein
MSALPATLRAMPLGRLRGQNNEGVLALTIVVLALAVGVADASFWTLSTMLNIVTSTLDNLIFAMGALIVIISGGIDVSFMAIGIFAGYSVVVLTNRTGFGADTAWVGFALAGVIGVGLGTLNALSIAALRLPTLIATLGTQGIIRGVLLAYVGSKVVPNYPAALNDLSTNYLVTAHGAGGDTRLSILILPAIVICVLVSLMLRYTMIGRGIFAIGGEAESARRAGFPVTRIQVFIYLLVGLLAGIAGLMHVTQVRLANPYELVGGELDVIAAVVLGGASIFGGKGSVLGTVLGVVLIALIRNSLILLGPGTWQRAAVGAMLIIGVTAQVLSSSARRRPVGGVGMEATT